MGWVEDALDVVFPPLCLACDAPLPPRGFFCGRCDASVQALEAGGCTTCGEPGSHPNGRCARCRARPVAFTLAFAPFVHDGALARAIHRFKYEDKPELAGPLGTLLFARARNFLGGAPAMLVPVPLHPARFRERKYDHATLLAVELARHAGLALGDGALTRVRDTPRQVGLSDEERAHNVSGAFTAAPKVSGQRVLLLDDVLTTGATAHAAAQTLGAAGATEVRVLTLARAVLRGG